MASAFGHAALGATLGKLLLSDRRHWPYWVAAALCAALPDVDSIGYRLGVPYDSLWGHRGLTHSLLAAAVVAAVGTALAQLARSTQRPPVGRLALLLFLATASHGLLDAMTTGGLGVAFFSPWDLKRYFFGFRPIKVSPISIRGFFQWPGPASAGQRSHLGGPAVPAGAVAAAIICSKQQVAGRLALPTKAGAADTPPHRDGAGFRWFLNSRYLLARIFKGLEIRATLASQSGIIPSVTPPLLLPVSRFPLPSAGHIRKTLLH